jgi:DNA-binding NarL/FixJ family response regulator
MTGPLDPVQRPGRILIVDDEPLNVDYLEQELDGLGFETETAADGLEALARVAAAPPDLVLLDVMMPGMDGISALRILKGDPETKLIPVILMTALNAVEDRVRGIEAGADDFLSKPVDERELLARIRTALATKRTIDETVDELRSTTAHLERHGRQQRDVAVLAIDWRVRDASVPETAVGFVVRRHRTAAEERIQALGGLPSENGGSLLVAVFDAPDLRARALAALEAARAVLDDASTAVETDGSPPVSLSAAVSVGSARVGSTRVRQAGGPRWLFGAEGAPVDWASSLAREASECGVLVAGDAAAVVSDRFALEPVGEGAYRVLAPTTGAADEVDSGPSPADRRIRTILTTDIVDSTRTAEHIGDRAWGEVVTAHERETREALALFGGEEIDTTGDGFIVAFDSAARAIRCALALLDRLAGLGLTLRAGIHTGEVEHVDGRARGIALHVASRIAARANPGEILLSATTRELAAGAGLAFTDRGEQTLKGVAEPRRLYAAAEAHAVGREPASRRLAHTPAAGPPRVAYPAGLTAREVDVLRLVAVGLSDAETAQRLFLSVRTVNAHLRSIYRKVGVRSRAAAGRFAEEQGLL